MDFRGLVVAVLAPVRSSSSLLFLKMQNSGRIWNLSTKETGTVFTHAVNVTTICRVIFMWDCWLFFHEAVDEGTYARENLLVGLVLE